MREAYLFIITFMFFESVEAQNLQLHYDSGKGRNYVTSTFEYIKFSEKATTFMFLDMNYGRADDSSLSYWEIFHEFNINTIYEGLSIHV